MPVLQPYFFVSVQELPPLLDLMEDLEQKLGFRVGLDSVARSTLGVGKTGDGLDAVRFFAQGRMEELKQYCLNDVKITRELYEYGRDNGRVYVMTRGNTEKKEVPVEWGAHQVV